MIYTFKSSCSKKKLRSIRAFVRATLKKHQVDEFETNMIVLAVDEVCANLMIHSNQCNTLHSLELSMDFDKNNKGVRFEIFDKGLEFDLKNYKEPSLHEVVRSKKKGGIGLILVKKIMDRIEFTSRAGNNVCQLYKKIESHTK